MLAGISVRQPPATSAAAKGWELSQTVRDVEPEVWGGITVAPW
jgi:hypothetical protein